ncbi:hypothetical protein ACIBK9_47260 [Nonomuraea sp. NPDC050227]|uniref:hypothetical protein n=1 Tax=Nonomuraea sp. NPDC050227 TaxID=3364360 RepID=UPI0037ABB2CB
MADFNIPRGPIDSEPLRAILADPSESTRLAKTAALQTALDGVELGEWDRTILVWLAGWEPSTVAVVCSWLHRVREAPRG